MLRVRFGHGADYCAMRSIRHLHRSSTRSSIWPTNAESRNLVHACKPGADAGTGGEAPSSERGQGGALVEGRPPARAAVSRPVVDLDAGAGGLPRDARQPSRADVAGVRRIRPGLCLPTGRTGLRRPAMDRGRVARGRSAHGFAFPRRLDAVPPGRAFAKGQVCMAMSTTSSSRLFFTPLFACTARPELSAMR
jgi:hypothetical protein